MFAGKKSAQIREILISESAWEEMTCLFAPSLIKYMISIMRNNITISPPITTKRSVSILLLYR
ncbi:TPA_asm: hypothetical protein GBV76_15220 [Salmonella enterica subsp. enterica]|nr:hypothetical protein [Salmonella enterica subsp. enterica]